MNTLERRNSVNAQTRDIRQEEDLSKDPSLFWSQARWILPKFLASRSCARPAPTL